MFIYVQKRQMYSFYEIDEQKYQADLHMDHIRNKSFLVAVARQQWVAFQNLWLIARWVADIWFSGWQSR